jgi:probable blue pigment (indigoidine) exporter
MGSSRIVGHSGVLSALLPLIAAVIGYVFFSEKLPIRAVAGLIIGFTGIGLLLRPGSGFDVFGVTNDLRRSDRLGRRC